MKKFIFSIFAICLSTPSFADICGNKDVINDSNQLLAYDTTLQKLGNRVSCNAATNKNWMVGCNGKIYECKNNKWTIVTSHIRSCAIGWENNAASDRNKPANTISNPTDDGFIYFFNPNQDSFKNSICQYTKTQCDKDIADCTERGDYPASCTICGSVGPITGAATNTPFTITCDDTAGNGCRISGNINKFEIRQCSDIKAISHGKPVVITKNKNTRCITQIGNLKRTCDIVLRETDEYYVYVCVDDPIFITKGTKYDYNNEKDLSYEEKKCRGSGGNFNNGNCTCPNSQTKPNNGECLCTTGNTKYLVGNNCNEGTACISTGGDPTNDSKCNCPEHMRAVKLHADSDIEVCECDKGYHYRDPMRRWEGCVKINDTVTISGTVVDNNGETIPYATVKVSNSSSGTTTDNNGKFSLANVPNTEYVTFSSIGYKTTTWAATDLQEATVRMYTNTETLNEVTVTASPLTPEQSEQITMPGTPNKACEYSGGTYQNNQCTCDSNEYLEPYEPENAKDHTICTCMRGYKRKNAKMDTNGNTTWYPEKDPCIPANDYEIQIKRDDMAMQRDAEAAYRNEYDNAQSWANKGTTALSTLMTGEGAMMAARAIAEKKADNEAKREMAEYVSKMKCEYGGGQSVNLGDTETLPGGNELANYYAEYKQLADKLKATKAALNLRPGIEAEVLYDRAETGLYQYQTAERQSGGFTSLSRALMNPEGADATAWNAQRAETNQNLLVGGALATVGLAGSYIANRAINKDHVKKYKELEEKFNKIETKLLNAYPEIFKPKEQEVKIEVVEEIVEEVENPQPQVQPKNSKYTIEIFVDDVAFNPGHITLTSEAEDALKSAATEINGLPNDGAIISKISITTTGYTDPDPIKSTQVNILTNEYTKTFGNLPSYYNGRIDNNPELSQARAEMVLTSITNNINDNLIRFLDSNAYGTPNGSCTERKENYSKCRKVKIEITVQAEYAE